MADHTPLRPHKRSQPATRTTDDAPAAQRQHIEAVEPLKSVRCNIHGTIDLEPLLVAVMDTHIFQRLKRLRQLGCADHVYPTATHSRFEHSIGVAHLAGRLCRKLQTQQMPTAVEPPSERDILCVKLAGLCHDLGHGPFSHTFENVVPGFKHEEMSVKLLDLLFRGPHACLRLSDFSAGGEFLKDHEDLTFVKELIDGVGPAERRGRKLPKWYLYNIVSSRAIDVDRLDYLSRDPVSAGCFGPSSCVVCCPRLPLLPALLPRSHTRVPRHRPGVSALRAGQRLSLCARPHLRQCRRADG